MSYSGADLSTVDPNPTVWNYGDSSTADDISRMVNVAGQWGTAIASVITGNPVQSVSTPQGVMTVGARGSSVMSPSIFAGSSGILLLLVGVVIVVLLVKK